MSSIPVNLGRVPNLLISQAGLAHLNRTNLALFRVQQQLSTGLAINAPSDDPVKAAAVGVLDDRLERSAQVKRNLSHASSSLDTADNALQEASDLAHQARSIATAQLAITSSGAERRQQATIIDQILRSMLTTATRKGPAGYVFGGSLTSEAPVRAYGAGYRLTGEASGLVTDLDPNMTIPITLGAGNGVASRSARVRGDVDLNPMLSLDTRLVDVRGGRGLGVSLGSVEMSINGGARVSVDLTGSDTVRDVATRITAAIRQYEADNSVSALGAGGVSASGEAIAIDAVVGATIEFFDPTNGVTARDLGLTAETPFPFSPTQAAGVALDPKLTWRTPIAALAGITGALGSFEIKSLGRSATIDLSTATTLEDVKNAIEGTNLGLRVAINADATGIDVFNDVSAGRDAGLSIEEISGQNLTATRLGIRSFTTSTRIHDFNDGRGVEILDASVNPTTGLPDPLLDADFQITLGDPARTVISIDLRPQDMATVQTLLDRVNGQAATQLATAGLPATSFRATLSDGSNGLRLVQDASFAGAMTITPRNNSPAAEQLGLMGGAYDATNSTWSGQDRAKVRVDGLFTQLIDLRDALVSDDVRGITLAGEGLERSIAGLAETRGLVGGHAQRVDAAIGREDDRSLLDRRMRGDLADADFAEASTRFNLLQTQLQAALRVAGASQQQSLLDFLG